MDPAQNLGYKFERVTPATANFPPPTSADEMDNMAEDALRERYGRRHLVRFGRSGQYQGGIDGLDQENPTLVWQTSLQEAKVLAKIERDLVAMDRDAVHHPDVFVVALGFPRDANLQRDIQKISERRKAIGKCRVDILFWEDIRQILVGNARLLAKHFKGFGVNDKVSGSSEVDFATLLQTGIRPFHSRMPPSKMLVANYESVGFQSDLRLPELRLLTAFCEDTSKHLDVLAIVGPAGAGKTRLMIEWCKRLRFNGWIAGFLETEMPNGIRQGHTPNMIVIDYAETRLEDIRTLLENLPGRVLGGPVTRVVLLARESGSWLSQLRAEIPWFDDVLDAQPVHQISELTLAAAVSFYDTCVKSLSVERGNTLAFGSVGAEYRAHPLYVQMLAMNSGELREESTGDDLLAQVLERERRFWWKTARTLKINVGEKFRRHIEVLAWVSALAQEAMPPKMAQQCTRIIMPDFDERHYRNASEVLAEIYGCTARGGIKAIKPDLLAEYSVATGAAACRSALLQKMLGYLLTKVKNAAPSLTLLGRLMGRGNRLRDACKQALRGCLPIVLRNRGVPEAVAAILTKLDDLPYVSSLDLTGYEHLPVIRVAVTGVQYRHVKQGRIVDPREIFVRSKEYSSALGSFGERQDLVEALEDAATRLRRELDFPVHSDVLTVPDLGRGKGSLALLIPPRVSLHTVDPVSVMPNGEAQARLADLLIRQATGIADAFPERLREAFQMLSSARICIDHPMMSSRDRYVLMGDWLQSKGLLFIQAGQWGQAQESIEQATRMRRSFASENEFTRAAYSQTLLNLAICYHHQGKDKEALVQLEEAETILGSDAARRERGKILYNRAVVEQSIGGPAAVSRALSALRSCLVIREGLSEEMPSEGHLFELAIAIRAMLAIVDDSGVGVGDVSKMAARYLSVCEHIDALRADAHYAELLVDACLRCARLEEEPEKIRLLCERAAGRTRQIMFSTGDARRLFEVISRAAMDRSLRPAISHVSELLWLAKILGERCLFRVEEKVPLVFIHNDLCAALRLLGSSAEAIQVAESGERLYAELERAGILAAFAPFRTERLRLLGNAGSALLESGQGSKGVRKFLELAGYAVGVSASAELRKIVERIIEVASEHSVLAELRADQHWWELEKRASEARSDASGSSTEH